jgi:signal transduction histidine kinase/CheY-like chemotaxis protein
VDFTDAEFSILEDSSVVAAISLAMDGRILGANAYLRRFFGVGNNSDLAGRALREFLVHEDDWALWAAGGQVTTQLRSPAGKVLVLRGDVRSSRLPSGRRLYGIFVEVADEQPLRAAAQHSARMEALGSLTAGIAHDFNNLLTVLVGNIYLVAEELRDRPKAFERIKAARDAGKRGAELIKQLLAFARREQLDHGVVDPCKVVDGIVPLLRRAVGTRITLETQLEAGAGSIHASMAQLESVIVNLTVNARDAIEGKGRVSIDVRRVQLSLSEAARHGLERGQYLALSVRDNGNGIPAEVISRVFEPFFSTKGERGGTGLGLSMVRWFAEQSGGTALVESVVGEGTTVTLLLARSQEQVVEAGDKTMPLSTLPTGNERVVVLAPDDALRSTIHQILEVLGYSVAFTASVEEMLAALRAEDAQLLIVDGLGRNDADVLIRARAVCSNLKVIVTADANRAAEKFAAIDTNVVMKPFSLADLAGAVRRTLDAVADDAKR